VKDGVARLQLAPDGADHVRLTGTKTEIPWADVANEIRESPDYDSWLTTFFDDQLAEIDRACAIAKEDEAWQLFRELQDDLWAVLLTRDYRSYPNIQSVLPDTPELDLQWEWNGAVGLHQLSQSRHFYGRVCELNERHGRVPLNEARILDFGCGWGRLTRYFARHAMPDRLFGCDPTGNILDVCAETGVPGELKKSEFVPESLPFENLDLAFSFSVFTHISEDAHRACLEAIHNALAPGGLLVVTVRPPSYLELDPPMGPARRGLSDDYVNRELREPRYIFLPHLVEEGHPLHDEGATTYGDTVISFPYIEKNWTDLFEIAETGILTGDMYQVPVALRKK
ncbi:MAG TPA: class I SAM-dependent methyltransferase, partial [Solirubrobacterales bacterium]|nr:class I SAM-dependent methyltransferase [Solirubrobacterales bacterium]